MKQIAIPETSFAPTNLAMMPALSGRQSLSKTFTLGVPISAEDAGSGACVAIDSSGNAIAVWGQRTSGHGSDQVWTKSRPANGRWGPENLVCRSLGACVLPVIRASAGGKATAIWTDACGVWTVDCSAAGVWNVPHLILPGVSAPLFLMNSRGDATLLWASGNSRGGVMHLKAMRRLGGQTWGPPEIIAAGVYARLSSAALGDNGDLAVAWEAYTPVCSRRGERSDLVLHISRQTPLSTVRLDSGPLTPPGPSSHDPHVAVDSAGRAVCVYASRPGTLAVITQATAGSPWKQPATVYSGNSVVATGLSVDNDGKATIALQDLSNGAGSVNVIDGNIETNEWSTPITISEGDRSPTQVTFAGDRSGVAVLAWAAGDPDLSDNAVRASVRRRAGAAWTIPQTISPAGVQLASPESVAVNADGNATVLFSAFNSDFSLVTGYASSYEG